MVTTTIWVFSTTAGLSTTMAASLSIATTVSLSSKLQYGLNVVLGWMDQCEFHQMLELLHLQTPAAQQVTTGALLRACSQWTSQGKH